MKRFLKIGLAFAIASLITVQEKAEANMADYNECCCTPCDCMAFETYFRPLLLLPCGGGLDYAAEATPLPLPSPNWDIHEIKPDYAFGFDIGVGAVFCGQNTNLFIEWQHFHSTASASRVVNPSSNMIGPFFEIGPDAAPYTRAHGHASFHFDEVNIDYGFLCNFGCGIQTNIFAGVSGVHIKQSLHSKYSNEEGTIERFIDSPCSFTGAGPHVGFNATYKVCNGFYLAGDAEAALLVGKIKNHTTYESYFPDIRSPFIPSPNIQETSVDHKTRLVPSFGGRLGLGYSFTCFCNLQAYFEAGYEARVYINALETVDMGSEVIDVSVAPSTVGVFARTFEKNVSNFALAGPYMSFKVTF